MFGMDFAPVAGNGASQFAPSFAVGGGPQAPGTEFATGNNPASLPAFTSETIAGPFGRNSAAAFPMTHSSTIVSYATAGVSAGVTAPATGSLVGAHSGARIVPTSSHAATSRRQHPRAIGANPSAANAGGLKLTPLEQHAGPNTGGSNVLQLTPELAAVPQPLVDAKLSPRDQLKATLRKIIKDASSSWTTDQIGQFNEGYVEGFRAGAKNTLDFIRSLDSQVASATVSVLNGAVWLLKVPGDILGSLLFRTPRSPDLDPNVVVRDVRRKIGNAVVSAQNAAQVLNDLTLMGVEFGEIVGMSGFSVWSRHPVFAVCRRSIVCWPSHRRSQSPCFKRWQKRSAILARAKKATFSDL